MKEQISMADFLDLCKAGEIDVSNAEQCYNAFNAEYGHYVDLVEKQFLKRIGYKLVVVADHSFQQ